MERRGVEYSAKSLRQALYYAEGSCIKKLIVMKIGVISDTHSKKIPDQVLSDFKEVDLIVQIGTRKLS